jgi:hypothetical protein
LSCRARLLCLCSDNAQAPRNPAGGGRNQARSGLAALDWGFDAVLVLLIHWARRLYSTNPLLSLALPVTLLLMAEFPPCRALQSSPIARCVCRLRATGLLTGLWRLALWFSQHNSRDFQRAQ